MKAKLVRPIPLRPVGNLVLDLPIPNESMVYEVLGLTSTPVLSEDEEPSGSPAPPTPESPPEELSTTGHNVGRPQTELVNDISVLADKL